jgi:hypothetical protein
MLVMLFSHLIKIYAACKTELLNMITIMYQDFYNYHQAQTLTVFWKQSAFVFKWKTLIQPVTDKTKTNK